MYEDIIEFCMTYGWAILVVIAGVSAFVFFADPFAEDATCYITVYSFMHPGSGNLYEVQPIRCAALQDECEYIHGGKWMEGPYGGECKVLVESTFSYAKVGNTASVGGCATNATGGCV